MKPSAVRSIFSRRLIQTSCVLWLLLTSMWAQGGPCGPSPAIRAQLGKITVDVSSPSDFDRALAPLLALRQRYPNDLWVNERYQDAVQQYGIEGRAGDNQTRPYRVHIDRASGSTMGGTGVAFAAFGLC